MDITAENLRFLVWREHRDLPRSHWASQLAQWTACSPERADHLLRHGGLTLAEQERIAEVLHIPEEDLLSARLLADSKVDILRENMRYLISELDRGGAARLAEALQVSPSTVSQWAAGTHHPSSKRLPKICDFFGIARSADLTNTPLFLSLEPVTIQHRKDWLKQRIDELQPELLQELFPALRRLLEER